MRRSRRKVVFTHNNDIQLVHSGKEFFDLLHRLIDGAKSVLHIQTYILAEDETGKAIASSLIRAAGRNVKVYVLVDGYASDLSSDFVKELEDAGVSFRFFEPLFRSKSLYFGRRLHHKVIVADALHTLVGGMNLADRYNDTPEEKAWFDVALYVHGEIAAQLHDLCSRLWSKSPVPVYKAGQEKSLGPAIDTCHRNCDVRVRRNDWLKGRQQIWGTYIEIFRTAKKDITIICSYFLPGQTFRRLLKRAADRGVRVNVILAGLSDIKTAKYAERYLYRWMLRNRINIYEYQPGVLHAKMAIADEDLLTIGSYNINDISAYASVELNLDVQNQDFCRHVKQELNGIIEKDCKEINTITYKTKLISVTQFLQWSAFQLIRFLLKISTFYFRRQE